MNEEPLAKLVRELDQQIGQARALTPAERERLENLRQDIDRILAQQQTGVSAADSAVLADLRTATERFESTHPGLAAALAQIVDVFTKLGF